MQTPVCKNHSNEVVSEKKLTRSGVKGYSGGQGSVVDRERSLGALSNQVVIFTEILLVCLAMFG